MRARDEVSPAFVLLYPHPLARFAATLGELTGGRVGLTGGSVGVLKVWAGPGLVRLAAIALCLPGACEPLVVFLSWNGVRQMWTVQSVERIVRTPASHVSVPHPLPLL